MANRASAAPQARIARLQAALDGHSARLVQLAQGPELSSGTAFVTFQTQALRGRATRLLQKMSRKRPSSRLLRCFYGQVTLDDFNPLPASCRAALHLLYRRSGLGCLVDTAYYVLCFAKRAKDKKEAQRGEMLKQLSVPYTPGRFDEPELRA
eukprot:5053027-Prymnesium_polylepis.1